MQTSTHASSIVAESMPDGLIETRTRLPAIQANANRLERSNVADTRQTQSDTGSWLIACRSTGSTLVYTSFVSCGLECSKSR
jgi:hypothetical protein